MYSALSLATNPFERGFADARAVRELSVTGAPGGDTADAPRELSENAAMAYASEPGATPGIGECVAAGISAPNCTARFSSIQS